MSRWRRLGAALAAAGATGMLVGGWHAVGDDVTAGRGQRELRAQLIPQLSSRPVQAAAATHGATSRQAEVSPRPGDPVALLTIPSLGVEVAVIEGVSTDQLRRGPGHYPGTARPGEPGNVAIAGHRSTYGAPFRRLDELRPGDPILLDTADGRFDYRVLSTRVLTPGAVQVTWPVPGQRDAVPRRALLTLTTCHPVGSAQQRLVVQAALDTGPDAAPAADPAAGGGR